MFIQCWKLAFTNPNQKGTNILVLKDIVHTGIKIMRGKATVITLDSYDQGHLKEISLEEEIEKEKKKMRRRTRRRKLAFSVWGYLRLRSKRMVKTVEVVPPCPHELIYVEQEHVLVDPFILLNFHFNSTFWVYTPVWGPRNGQNGSQCCCNQWQMLNLTASCPLVTVNCCSTPEVLLQLWNKHCNSSVLRQSSSHPVQVSDLCHNTHTYHHGGPPWWFWEWEITIIISTTPNSFIDELVLTLGMSPPVEEHLPLTATETVGTCQKNVPLCRPTNSSIRRLDISIYGHVVVARRTVLASGN